jgi:hypothetical protein
MMLQPVSVSRGIVEAPGTSVKRQAWMCSWHEFDHASASSVTTTPQSTPKFQEFAALGSTKSQCREIL